MRCVAGSHKQFATNPWLPCIPVCFQHEEHEEHEGVKDPEKNGPLFFQALEPAQNLC